MQEIILIKQHSSVQLAHLYEHLYCERLRELFFNKQLFESLDFTLSGTTFDQGGLIEVAVQLHTLKAQTLADQIMTQNIPLDTRAISLAFSQLLAEEEQAINVSSYEAVIQALTELNGKPWEEVDDFTILKARDVRLSPYPMHISKKHLPSRKIAFNLTLDADFAMTHPELIPLFRQITRVTAYTARYRIAAEEGFYMDTVAFIARPHKFYTKTTLRVANGNDEFIDVNDLLRQCRDVFRYIERTNAHEDFTRELHQTSYRHNPWDAPNTYDAYNETGIYLGSKGWVMTATLENCALLLANTTIEVAFGRQTASALLTSDSNL